jgi:hypothetical protein
LKRAVSVLVETCRSESVGSFINQNAGGLSVRLVSVGGVSGVELRGMTMPTDALAGGASGTRFVQCYLQPTQVRPGGLAGTVFEECEFEHLELTESQALRGAAFIDCRIRAVSLANGEATVFAPELAARIIQNEGGEIVRRAAVPAAPAAVEEDWSLRQVGRLLRSFIRSTELNEGTIRMKLGSQWGAFETQVFPELLAAGIVREVAYLGHGVQRRFRLGVPLRVLQSALEACNGDFERFVASVRERAG